MTDGAGPGAPVLAGAPDGVVLRPARASDVDALVTIERAAFPDPWDARSFRSVINAPAGRVTVAERAGDVVGYAVVLLAADEAELANLAVAAEARGQGVGRRLLHAVRSAAAAEGAEVMYLEVRESNAPARALYDGAGFTVIGRRRRYYRAPDEDALLMRWQGTPGRVPAE
jgi:ribosomal-protein-alanine N-acetyltransferase